MDVLLYVAAAIPIVWGVAHVFATKGVVAPATGVYVVAIAVLVVLTAVSLFTGFRIRFLPFRLCPVIFMVSAILTILGAWL